VREDSITKIGELSRIGGGFIYDGGEWRTRKVREESANERA